MKTMTIRNIPDEVAVYLSNRASSEGRSINTTTVTILIEASGLAGKREKKRDLSWLCGSWSAKEQRDFDRKTEECRKINPEDWK